MAAATSPLYAKLAPAIIPSIKLWLPRPCQRETIMVNADNLRLYLAVKQHDERSHMEDSLVLDGFNIRTFSTASEL